MKHKPYIMRYTRNPPKFQMHLTIIISLNIYYGNIQVYDWPFFRPRCYAGSWGLQLAGCLPERPQILCWTFLQTWCPYLSRLNLIIIIISNSFCNLFFSSSWFLYLWAAAPFEAFRGFLAYLAVATAFSNFSARTSPRHSIGSSGGADGVYVGPLSTSCVLTRQCWYEWCHFAQWYISSLDLKNKNLKTGKFG